MSDRTDPPGIVFESRQVWREWLAANHESSAGIWIKIAKKDSGIASVSHAEALDIALRYGWIDAQRRKLDDRYFLQRFTPRTPRSKWSKINRDRVLELIASGEMQPAGLRQVELAQADGRWDAAYDSQSVATIPEDLERALAENDAAREFFSTLDSRNRYATLYRLQNVKKAETRARRLAQFIAMLNERKKIYP